MSSKIKTVPTNIITGFFGVGKTSAILNLLKNKPLNERWAVLVNEFGEIGVDGSLFAGEHPQSQGVFIREVPGGCMCCAAGLPMQVALNQLLSQAKPDRLLIEPTGLGHPKEVLQILTDEHYQNILRLQKTLTLVDARQTSDNRYTLNHTFNQQIAIADTIVGNKQDLYKDGDKASLSAYVKEHGAPNVKIVFTEQGRFALSLLEGKANLECLHSHHHHHKTTQKPLVSELPIPDCGFIKAINKGEGFSSIGWRFSAEKVFNHKKLFALLCNLRVERMKAVIITDIGIFGYNLTPDALTETELDECFESRIEIISKTLNNGFEEQLMECVFN